MLGIPPHDPRADSSAGGTGAELMKCCSGSMVEIGGVWKIRVGAPALPSYYIAGEDMAVSKDQEFDEFPGLGSTVNGITATYPDPQSLWESHEAPPALQSRLDVVPLRLADRPAKPAAATRDALRFHYSSETALKIDEAHLEILYGQFAGFT